MRLSELREEKHREHVRRLSEVENVHGCPHEPASRHACPFFAEVLGNDNPEFCTCCKECEHNCAESI